MPEDADAIEAEAVGGCRESERCEVKVSKSWSWEALTKEGAEEEGGRAEERRVFKDMSLVYSRIADGYQAEMWISSRSV